MQVGALPSGEHPFNRALGAIYGDVEASLGRHHVGPGNAIRSSLATSASLPWRMESPDWAYSSGLNLPHDPVRRAEILAMVVRRLDDARRALPDAQYEITLDGKPFAWDEAKGFQPPE